MRRYSSKNRKGFTLGEMLITVAVVAILSAVAIISVVGYLWNVRLLDADQAAREVYLAAQYHLSLARERGTLDRYKDDLGTVDQLYKGSDYVNQDGGTLYDLVYSPGNNAADVINAILPQGSIDETMRTGGSYIITYDKDTATVVGVFYSYAGRSYGYSFSADTLTKEADALQNAMKDRDSSAAKAVRKHFPDTKARKTIGFYGGKDLAAAGKSDAPLLRIENGDTLNAIVTLSKEQNDLFSQPQRDHAVQLTIKGQTSGNTVTKVFDASTNKADVTTSGNGLYQYAVVLDAWQDQNGDDKKQIDWQFKDTAKPLIPGENITVTASIVKKNNDGSYSSASKPSNSVLTNSMFGSLKTVNGQYTVTISSIRHLENLSKISEDSAKQLNIANAKQVTDISFTAYQKNMASFFNSDKPEMYSYLPVPLKNELTYDAGYLDGDNARQYMLSDIDAVGGGVFDTLAKDKKLTVSNLQIVDINVKSTGSAYAGALLSEAGENSTVNTNNVLVWDKSATIGISAETDAGGLIGHSDGNVIIKNTAVSAYVKSTGGNAGGLIGSASSLSVSSSYVSAHTYQGDFVTDVNPQTDKHSQHYNIIAGQGNAGGIVGSVSSLYELTNSYVTASIYGKTANAFAGAVSDNDAYTKNKCYAVSVINGRKVKEPSTFSGIADRSTKYVNDESLLAGNDEVIYPFTVISTNDVNAKAWFLKTHVGDWTMPREDEKPSVSFNNDEILQLIASVPNAGPDDEVEIQFFYQGVYGLANLSSAHAYKTFVFNEDKVTKEWKITVKDKDGKVQNDSDWMSDLCKAETIGNVTTFTINIDDITYYKNGHHGNFTNVISQGSGHPAGYDVTARVMVNGTTVSDPVYTNSLYGDNTNKDNTVISCARHLQNVSHEVSDWRTDIFSMNLTSDIFWNTPSNSFFDRVKKLRISQDDVVDGVYTKDGKLIADKKFLSIDGSTYFDNNRKNSGFEGNGHTISDISFEKENGLAGLFGYIGINGFQISNLTIQNGKIQESGGVTSAGLFAGSFQNGIISHCFVTGVDSQVRIGTSGDAGGLAGYLQNTTVSDCGASAYVQGGNAGGLVGNFNSGTITASFSGGRTTNGSYLADANVEGSSNAGGLVGFSGYTITISNSYSSSSVFGGTKSDADKNKWSYTTGSVNVGGLVGNTSVQQDNAITNCYAVGMVQGPKSTTGALIGNYGQWQIKNALKGNYYLEGINFDADTLEELPAVSRPGGLDPNENHDSNFMAVDYYSSNNPIAKKDSSVTYITYSYDSTLKGDYPFISYTRQSDNSNISVHYGGWQIPVDKTQYRWVKLYDENHTTMLASKAVLRGSSFDISKIKPTNPDGKTFVGWIDANGNVLSVADFTSISKDITAYAKYSRQMTFKYVNPETGKEAGLVANVDFNTDDSVTVPKAPVISGYAFDGWYTTIDGGTKAVVVDGKISNPAIKTNIYYARYRQIRTYTYTMIFCYEKDAVTPEKEISSLNKIVYQRTSDNYSTFSQVVDLSNKTVANATVDKLLVVKNDDPKEVIRTDDNVNQKSTVTMTGDAFNKTYYVMYKAQTVTYTVEHIFHDSTTTLDDRTISDHNFAFKDGNGNDKLVYSKGDTVTLTETPTGYVGSKTRASLLDLSSVKDEFEVTSTFEQKNLNDVNSNVTIMIDYYRKKYTLEYSAPDANNYIPPVSIDYGAPVTLANKDQVVRPGYTLTDWTISYNGAEQSRGFEIASMPAADVTAVANWTVNKTAKVTVQFWQQRPFTKDSYTTADYDYYGAYTIDSFAIGKTYSVDPGEALSQLVKRKSTDFDHFTFTDKFGNSAVTVAADGSSTINLYYNRDEITINFYHSVYHEGYISGWRYWSLELADTWTGLYGQEFDEHYKWDNEYDWYELFGDKNGPSGRRLTFITYFHVEDDAKDAKPPNVMNLYGKKRSRGFINISHYLEKLNGTGEHNETGYDMAIETTGAGGSFTFTEKYPSGYQLSGYRYYSDNWDGTRDWRNFQSANSGDSAPEYHNLAVFYDRKDIPITLSNAVINNNQSGVDYQFTEKYGTSYETIAEYLNGLTVTKPVNAQGEEFVGWYLDAGCTQPFTGDDETLDGPLQLFAKWENCKYHVNFYGSGSDTGALNVTSGDVLYNVSAGVDAFPEISADEGYEVRWYYRDSDGVEHQYVKDRQIQLDLVSDKEKGSDGYYTINLYARKVAVNPVHLYYELYDQDAAQVITYQGSRKLETEETYSVGAAFTITPPELDGYDFVDGNTGVASSDTQENPIRLVYAAKQDSWRHIVESYARYADIDDSSRTAVSVKLSSRTALNDSTVQYAVDTAPELDGYTFVQSALLADENDTSYAVSDDSQITVNKPDSKDQSQVVRFWYTPSFDGTLQNSSAVYDGKEHSVSYQLNSVPSVGSNNTLVYKYTYSLNNASTATTYVQYAWTNADGTAGTYGNAPVNAGVYSVQVEILLYKDASVNTANLTSGIDLLTVYRNREAGSLTISPAALTITSGSQSWIYGTDGTGFHTNTSWTADVNGSSVDVASLPLKVVFLDTSKIQQPGTMANEFTVSFTDAGDANNYAVTKVYGSLHVDWQYKVKYVLSLPDVVYEAKSDAEKAEAVKNRTDVKPVEIVMQQFVVTSENPNVFDAAKADDSKPAALDGLKLTNGDAVQNVGYHNGDQTVTYVYTPDFDGVSIVKDDALGVYEMKLADDAEKLKKVLSALKPYLSDQTPDSSDDTPASDASDYQKYLGMKNSDYRLVYEMTYTQQNSAGTAGTSSTVVYLAGEDGTVKDKDGKAAVLSGSVPASGTYVVSGRVVLQHRSDVLDKDGIKTGDKWSDANIVYASSDKQNVTVTLK